MAQFENVSVAKQANVYFDGKCVSHSLTMADGTSKSVGVILPATLTFGTAAPETMELVAGECLVTLAGASEPVTYRGGESFSVPADSSFEIEVLDTVHYVCHYG
ncbi:pyrimidine/purine nucleoside phosphorylase [Nocardia sp. NPDC127579]|uniref:pyrimidine/purine nucleoside phosphorylase n=1 Tax=Nocardia sp. NPDC127579 TaxID=3345402 RepID=UPI003642921D